ncbi:MAG: hypothetical protein K2G63_06965 [Oscillospiraceae bacterium]|nr:hypothetical protein [Oscillospiraceae bacterium]
MSKHNRNNQNQTSNKNNHNQCDNKNNQNQYSDSKKSDNNNATDCNR